MELETLSKCFFVRALETEDVDIIYDLCCQNKLFYEYHPPFVTKESILDDMNALPPGKREEDKAYIGFFEGDTLVAVMDLIYGYPTEAIVWIGFFMMNTAYQKQGIGTQLIQEAAEAIKNAGYREIRLGVDHGNPQSFAFWKKNKFAVMQEKEYIVMKRILS